MFFESESLFNIKILLLLFLFLNFFNELKPYRNKSAINQMYAISTYFSHTSNIYKRVILFLKVEYIKSRRIAFFVLKPFLTWTFHSAWSPIKQLECYLLFNEKN